MKLSVIVAMCAVFVASQAGAAEKMQLKTKKDKVSYTIGLDMGNSLKKQAIDIDP